MEWKAKEKMENPLSLLCFWIFFVNFFLFVFCFFLQSFFWNEKRFFRSFFLLLLFLFFALQKKSEPKKWKKVKKFSKKKSEEKKQKKSKNKKMLLCFAKIEKNWKRQSFLSKFLWTKVFSQERSFNHSELAKNFFFTIVLFFCTSFFWKSEKKT